MHRPALIVFAKQPIPGAVKTRLQPDYTPQRAAAIATCLIRATVALAVSAWPGTVEVRAAPDAEHPLFREIARRFGVSLSAQGAGDLGARMLRAIEDGIERAGAAAVLGCDVPHCAREILIDAGAALARGANILGPAEDGGYYLIGLTVAHPALFADIAWGGPDVCATTLERARAIGVEFTLLPTLRDIDTAADLKSAAQQYPALREFL